MELLQRIDKLESTMKFEQVVAQMKENESKVRAEDREAFEKKLQQIMQEKEPQKKGRTKRLLKTLLPIIGKVALSVLTFPLLGGLPGLM
jgi:macrodomain Ter protein organizer (MatP/YcbG family)